MKADRGLIYVVPWNKYLFKRDGAWAVDEPINAEAALKYMINSGATFDEAKEYLKRSSHPTVLKVGVFPNRETIFEDTLNLWVPPSLTPVSGAFPRVEAILNWITAGDEGALAWLLHWSARKVQNPFVLPKVAVILLGTPGSGKSSYGRIMREMLGARNCAVIERAALESNFNSSWIGKLFVQAEEIVSPDHMKEIGERLKMLITSEELEIEAKGRDRRKAPNHMAWLFCSNDRVSPLQIEAADRRYSVFANHKEITDEYRALVAGCFDALDHFTPSFKEEVQGLYAYLMQLSVDTELVRLPHQTEARDTIIASSERGHDRFIREIKERGVDALIHDYPDISMYDEEWDFGERGIKTQYLYGVYSRFCKTNGFGRLSDNKFGAALRAAGWPRVRNSAGKAGRRPMCYIVPRSPADESAPVGMQTSSVAVALGSA